MSCPRASPSNLGIARLFAEDAPAALPEVRAGCFSRSYSRRRCTIHLPTALSQQALTTHGRFFFFTLVGCELGKLAPFLLTPSRQED